MFVYTLPFAYGAFALSISHTHTDDIVDLLIDSSKYICVSVAFVLFFYHILLIVCITYTHSYLF